MLYYIKSASADNILVLLVGGTSPSIFLVSFLTFAYGLILKMFLNSPKESSPRNLTNDYLIDTPLKRFPAGIDPLLCGIMTTY